MLTAELLESRRFLSLACDVGLTEPVVQSPIQAEAVSMNLTPVLTGTTTPGIPLVRRTYTGTYTDPSQNFTITYTLKIRKQEDRGTFAALRRTFTGTSNKYGDFTGEITSGKVQPNTRLRTTIVGTYIGYPFTATVFAKASPSGSQIKGDFSIDGVLFDTAGSTLMKKSVVTK